MINLKLYGLPLLRPQAFVCINVLPNVVGFGPHRVAQVLIKGHLQHSIGNFLYSTVTRQSRDSYKTAGGKNIPPDVFVFQEYFGRNKYRFWCSKSHRTLRAPRAGNRLINDLK